MEHRKLILVITLTLFISLNINSQKLQLEGFGGHSYFVDKNAGGYDLGIGINYVLTKSSMIGVSIGHSFNDISPLPSDLTEAKVVLKEESNRLPLGNGFGSWAEDGEWPKIRLEEQPNRYFRFNIALNYTITKVLRNENSFIFGIGPILSYRDEGEMIKLIETTKIRGLFVRPTDDHSIPIFSYNTYLDMGIKGDITYLFKKIRGINLGFKSGIIFYPKPGDFMLNNGIVIRINK